MASFVILLPMNRYNPVDIEPRWQKMWQESGIYAAEDFSEKPKYVMLTEFPYPSGDGLHLGHTREYTLGDIMARYKRMQGYNVLYPMGYDAFGLPTENYAIKNKIAPQVATAQNVANFRKQFDKLGFSFDWSRSFSTTDPDYYKWTQWLFLQFYKNDMAYQADIAINWCPKCKTGLANEEVAGGLHERCDTPVEKKTLRQWMLRITKYADRLIEGLKDVDYPSRIADQQVNWIGRSIGAEIDFEIVGQSKEAIRVFTTRPDTIFGVTFMVLAPEHPLVSSLTTDAQRDEVDRYIRASQAKSDIERQDTDREKTGVFTGGYAINPMSHEKIPIWIADYVLMGYGTGAIMAVPAHDERDGEFARRFELPITDVVAREMDLGDDKRPRDGAETLRREVVDAIILNQKGEYLLMQEDDQIHFVGGGIDENEVIEDAIRREVAEESGYTDIQSMKEVSHSIYTHAYRFTKQKNQITTGKFYEVVLASDTRQHCEADEGRHRIFWASLEEALARITWVHHQEGLRQYLEGKDLFTGDGVLINSGSYDDVPSAEARELIVQHLEREGKGMQKVNYRLRDWIFSRQHYWGEPIPIIHCPEHGAVAVPDDQLPVTLPDVDKYEPTDTGESPLAAMTDWVNTTCPTCGGPAKRETDTMPNWAGSSWYYARYFDAHNDRSFADRKKLEYWGMVDMYLGGMEHTTLHLLYSRFWHQFLHDIGLYPMREPYAARRGQGIILAEDGRKMSKSLGNVINPNDVIDSGYGADALRLCIAFIAPYDMTTPWSSKGVAGTYRYLTRLWSLVHDYIQINAEEKLAPSSQRDLERAVNVVIKKVTQDLLDMGFNTAVAGLMEYLNELYAIKNKTGFSDGATWGRALRTAIQLTAPFAPHITEELWSALGEKGSVHTSSWPTWDESKLVSDTITLAVQVNGKVRAEIIIPTDADEESVKATAMAHERTKEFLGGKQPKRVIYVTGRLVNIVV